MIEKAFFHSPLRGMLTIIMEDLVICMEDLRKMHSTLEQEAKTGPDFSPKSCSGFL
jgi:hypothetical protein